MVRGLQAAAAAMAAEQTRVDLIAHNLANADTAGFRRLVAVVRPGPDAALYRRDIGTLLGALVAGPPAPQVVLDRRVGVPVATGNAADVSVDGEGFLLLEDGRIARSGTLGVDPQGFVTLNGVRVLGQDGPIRARAGSVEVGRDGTVLQGGRTLGRLRVVSAPPDAITPLGSGTYTAPPQSLRDRPASVRSGVRERPPTNPVEELVQLIASLRAYEAAQRCIQTTDETLSRWSDQVARI
jgi:flagellar basal-body rod protein FlgF